MKMDKILFVPPELLMGEAGICGFWAMVAVAWVYQRNQRMNGWHDSPSEQASLAAALWPILPDMSGGSRYVFSAEDLAGSGAREIAGPGPPVVVYQCAVGRLAFFR